MAAVRWPQLWRPPTRWTRRLVNPYANSTPLKVGIAFYAGCGLADYQCGTQKNGKPASCWGGLSGSKWASYAPLQMLHGTADSTVSIQSCTTRTALAQNQPGGASVALAAFNNAQHSFDDPSNGIGNLCRQQQHTQ
jgi:dienelactone hydrolase